MTLIALSTNISINTENLLTELFRWAEQFFPALAAGLAILIVVAICWYVVRSVEHRV